MATASATAAAATGTIGYARVSTAGQAADGVSLEAQQGRIESWCRANGRTLGGLFVDAGLSGKRADNRPELLKALAAVCERPKATKGRRTKDPGQSRVLVVYSLSRLSRSLSDLIAIAGRLHKAGADLVSLSEQIDTTSAMGKAMFHFLGAMAELERDLISERTSAALQHMRRQNKRVGGIPYGFALGADGETLHAIAAEQDVIKRIVAWRGEGLTLRAIADRLAEQRVPAKQGRRWHPSPIMEILRRAADGNGSDAADANGPQPAPQSENGESGGPERLVG